MATPLLPNNPENYIIPSQISVWFASLQDDGTLGTRIDLGNVMNITLSLADEYLDHESARNGLMAPDKSVIAKLNGELKFVLDELVGNNLVLAFRPKDLVDLGAVYTVYEQKRIRLNGVEAKTIDSLAVETDEEDYLELDNVVVRSADGVTTYVDVTDYTFTQAAGTGTGKTPATIARSGTGSVIPDGSEVVVTYTYSREARLVKIQQGAILEGELRIQVLSRIGPMCAYVFPFVSIRIDGDIVVNPSEWMKQGFSCKVLTAGDGTRGEFYLFDRFQKLSLTL